MDIKIYFFLFLIYSILGWCMEVILGIINNKKLVNRGFLIGPYCPIYGCGGVLITVLLDDFKMHPFAMFCMAIVICGVLEYFTSFVMEKLFKARWWDYSRKKYNINGRVCLETIIPFGLLSLIIMYITNPFFVGILERIPSHILKILFIICLLTFIVDCVISLVVISRLRSTVKRVNKGGTLDNTEEITKKVREILLGKTVLDRRLVKAFPRISIEDVKKKIRKTTEQVKENVSKVTEEATEYIKESASHVKENTLKVKDELTEHIREGTSKIIENTIKAKDGATEYIKETVGKVKTNSTKTDVSEEQNVNNSKPNKKDRS